ncbi:MAG: NADPH-dependent FMN reductase [Desulfotomaculum sp. 46_80]|nr:MAG: NADPH-dependent FMN reductase [Desulfotomaculum sp. 46_80]
MKVILVNGSPNEKGCTYTALQEVEKTLRENGIETEIFQVGNKPISGCIGFFTCTKNGKCFRDDTVNDFLEKASSTNGFVFGSPVHFAAASVALTHS